MSSFHDWLQQEKDRGLDISTELLTALTERIERMDDYDKIHLMDLEDHIESRISDAIYEVEAGEDM